VLDIFLKLISSRFQSHVSARFRTFPLFQTIARNETWDIKISVNQISYPTEIPDSAIVALQARFEV